MAVQAVLSPGYIPVTNLDVLKAAKKSLDASNVRVTFQPEVGDVLSGG